MGTDCHLFIQIFNNQWLLLKQIYDISNPNKNFNLDILEDYEFYCDNTDLCNHGELCYHCYNILLSKIDIDISRDYSSFAALASVRGQGRIPKGLPDIDYKLKCILNDFHSHTYFNENEINELENLYAIIEIKKILKQTKERYSYPIRFIICFDS